MSISQTAQGVAEAIRPFSNAVRMNLAAAIRTRRRGYDAWTGAVNTDYDPQNPITAAQPFDAYRALHRSGRVHYNPRRATWIVSRLDDVRAALRDTDQVTSTQGVTRLRMSAPLAVLTDGEEHTRLRKQIQPGFSKGAMSAWQEIVEKLAVELVSDLLNNPGCDVVQHLAIPMPIRLIAQILGVPEGDVNDFRRWSENAVKVMEFTPTRLAEAVRSISAMVALQRYFVKQFAEGGLKGSGTVLGRLLQHNTDGSLTDRQLWLIAIHLLIAGNETTTNLLGGMFDTLARHSDQYDLIRANPDLVPIAVEEQLRITTPIQNLYRYTRADYQIGGVTIPSGSRLLLSFGAANRDPAVFDQPDEYRADRNPRAHVAFGYGAHMCIGAPLARMEAQAVLRQLVTHVKRIAPGGPTEWSTHSSLRGPTHLPLHLTPA
ncbi:cytochrome P450 [Mycobacterium colombiense]|uniref:Cytochrome P450 n=1 Tax=Mycobacterium colombiense TaxID=339268 RepID=A0A329L184_9MYCO|nr:cytochrome P450 [Mycobacterium colombiense]RAV00032.1 cytochrome P450 [Mycobacterium colombiense]